ncbi:putative germin-like protein 2-1 [Chenopodium quinoa]|uniref:putative germin-like protein 2-1 n=1 Tax=Chenopodium quinoa TaxID=63459 RepID=UPI000B76D853|nr:putative germin-like protein 2-1 [Chenopodium quinoa]
MEKKITMCVIAAIFTLLATLSFTTTNASDPAPLQDFCVGVDDPHSGVFVNGKFCKNPKRVTINDFLYKGFNRTSVIDNPQGAEATLVNVDRFPGLNTLGVAIARVDFAPFGLNTPHLHPRASQAFVVMKGTLYAGFVTTDYKLYDTIMNEGDLIVFPQSLIHFQLNLRNTTAFAIAAFGSQNPGRINVANGVFGTTPKIIDDVLTKAFQVNRTVIDQLRSQFSSSKHVSIDTARSMLLEMLSQI